jgi:hypothetical protein
VTRFQTFNSLSATSFIAAATEAAITHRMSRFTVSSISPTNSNASNLCCSTPSCSLVDWTEQILKNFIFFYFFFIGGLVLCNMFFNAFEVMDLLLFFLSCQSSLKACRIIFIT